MWTAGGDGGERSAVMREVRRTVKPCADGTRYQNEEIGNESRAAHKQVKEAKPYWEDHVGVRFDLR